MYSSLDTTKRNTVSVLQLLLPQPELLNHPVAVRPAVDVLVVQTDVAFAVILLLFIAIRDLHQKLPVHPCLIALFIYIADLI